MQAYAREEETIQRENSPPFERRKFAGDGKCCTDFVMSSNRRRRFSARIRTDRVREYAKLLETRFSNMVIKREN